MKIAILGGSFNPVHCGHLALAEDVCDELGYDKMLFIPVFQPPHKIIKDAADGTDRLEMLKIACSGDSRFEAESCELDRGGVSYTYDTVLFLQKKYEGKLDAKIGLVFGQDLAAEFYKWNHADEISRIADIILARRPSEHTVQSEVENQPSGEYTGIAATDEMLLQFPYAHTLLKNPLMPVSSTDIRRRIASGKTWRNLVPDGVYRYIKERKLYGYKD